MEESQYAKYAQSINWEAGHQIGSSVCIALSAHMYKKGAKMGTAKALKTKKPMKSWA